MKMSKRVLAGLGVLMLSASPFLQAAPNDHGRDDHGRGPEHHDDHGRGGPPRDFGPVREQVQSNRQYFGHYQPRPSTVVIERGRPMPRGYGRPLTSREMAHMPRYPGYQWRRVGGDVALVAITTGVVYEVLENVLN